MRGFTMILVVVSHVLGSYHCDAINSYTTLFKCFRMPLFFFISGWVLYKKDVIWDCPFLKSFLKKKFLVQIIPTAIFMSVVLLRRSEITWKSFDYFKSGYWFTIALFEYFVIYSFFRATSRLIQKNRYEDQIVLLSGLLIYLLYYCLLVSDEDTSTKAKIINYIGIQQWCYYIFFCIGTLVKKYYNSFVELSDQHFIITIVLILFFCISIFFNQLSIPLWNTIKFLTLGTTGIFIVLTFFRRNEANFKNDHKIGFGLQYIGRRTLDIYLLHYFFLPGDLSSLGAFLERNGSPVVEFVISLLLASITISICLVVSNVLRMSPFLATYLFGANVK